MLSKLQDVDEFVPLWLVCDGKDAQVSFCDSVADVCAFVCVFLVLICVHVCCFMQCFGIDV